MPSRCLIMHRCKYPLRLVFTAVSTRPYIISKYKRQLWMVTEKYKSVKNWVDYESSVIKTYGIKRHIAAFRLVKSVIVSFLCYILYLCIFPHINVLLLTRKVRIWFHAYVVLLISCTHKHLFHTTS